MQKFHVEYSVDAMAKLEYAKWERIDVGKQLTNVVKVELDAPR